MSRIGNRLIQVPANITVTVNPDSVVLSNGTNQLIVNYNKFLVELNLENNVITTKRKNSSRESHMQQGTINALVNNAIIGLTVGFKKTLNMVGVGYKAALAGDKLTLTLGFSHPIVLDVPKEIKVELPSQVEIRLASFDKQLLGEFAANIRKWRKPEPYKGKGIAYSDEYILRKVGKTSEGGKK